MIRTPFYLRFHLAVTVNNQDEAKGEAANEKPLEKTETTNEENQSQPIGVGKSRDSRSAKRSGNLARR